MQVARHTRAERNVKVWSVLVTWHGRGYSSLQSNHRGAAHLLWGVLSRAALSGSHHVWLKQGTLQEDAVVNQGLVGV